MKPTHQQSQFFPGQLMRAKELIRVFDKECTRMFYIQPNDTFMILDISERLSTENPMGLPYKTTLLLSDGLIVECRWETLFYGNPVKFGDSNIVAEPVF